MMPIALCKSSSEITSGGAKRILKTQLHQHNLQRNKIPGAIHVHVNMCRLGQHTTTLEQQAKLPRRAFAGALRFVDHDSVEQPTSAHLFHERVVEGGDRLAELFTKN